MDISTYDLYAMQLSRYLIINYEYQIVRVQQHKDDIWLMNPKQENYPVLRISSKENACTLSDTEYIRNVHRIILNLIHREGPIMILNTNPKCALVDNALMTQIRITKDEISNARILSVFPGIDHVIHDVKDETTEFATITKEIEEAHVKQQKASLERAKKAARPKQTMILMAICIIWFIATFVLTLLSKNAVLGVVATGGYYKMNVVAAHEFYRLISAGFVHGDVFQLIIELYVFFHIGKLCERMYPKKYYILIFLSSIWIGNLFVFAAAENTLSYGISAGVLGLIAAYFVALIGNGAWRLPTVRLSAFRIIWYAILMMLVSGVPMIGMLGGVLTGVFIGILCSGNRRLFEVKKHIRIAGSILLVALGYLCTQVSEVQPIRKELDDALIDVYRNTPMNAYANYLSSMFQKQYAKEELE